MVDSKAEPVYIEVVAPTMDQMDEIWEQVGKLYKAYYARMDKSYETTVKHELYVLMSMWDRMLD